MSGAKNKAIMPNKSVCLVIFFDGIPHLQDSCFKILLGKGFALEQHPFDSGDSDCETILDQLYQAYAESH